MNSHSLKTRRLPSGGDDVGRPTFCKWFAYIQQLGKRGAVKAHSALPPSQDVDPRIPAPVNFLRLVCSDVPERDMSCETGSLCRESAFVARRVPRHAVLAAFLAWWFGCNDGSRVVFGIRSVLESLDFSISCCWSFSTRA